MAFALLLMQTGCGTQSEEIDSSKTTNETADSDPEAEEAKDKFVMLQEVYDILSGPLGEPYRTPEYWGGEEIDMMRVGDGYDGYLIGLRNVQNEMHYLLYEQDSDAIVEIDTQGKRIAWQDIDYQKNEEQLRFPYFEKKGDTQGISGTIAYNLIDQDYSQESKPVSYSNSFWQYNNEIPVPQQLPEDVKTDFSCLLSIYNVLSQPQTPSMSQNEITKIRELFQEQSLVILNQPDYWLIGLRQDRWTTNYYLYEKEENNLLPMEIYPIMVDFEQVRFQQNEGFITFPYSGEKILDVCDFPTTVMYDRESGSYTEYLYPLLSDHPLHLQAGATTQNPWECYRTLINQDSPQTDVLCVYYEMSDMTYSCDPPYYPSIFFESHSDRSVSILIDNAHISQEAKQALLNFDSARIQNLNVQEVEKEVFYAYGGIGIVQGLEISFTVPDGYSLFGEVTKNQNKYDTGGYLKLYFSDNEIISQNYILEYESLGWY